MTKAVNSHEDTGGQGRTPQDSCDGTLRESETLSRRDPLAVAHDEGNLAEEVSARNGRIETRHSIPFRLNVRLPRPALSIHYTMGDETPTVAEKNDVAVEDFVAGKAFHDQCVARPDGGEHAPSHHA